MADADQPPVEQGYRNAVEECRTGGVKAAWARLEIEQPFLSGYLIGYRQGVWDYENEHMMTHSQPPRVAYGTRV